MTACVNETEKKAKGGVFQSKVLRAAMAGVLAVGMMPAMALAAEPAESEAVPMAVQSVSAFEAGKVTVAKDNTGAGVDTTKAIEWTVNGEAHYVVPTQVTPKEGAPVDVTSDDYEVNYYKKDSNGGDTIRLNGENIKVSGVAKDDITTAGTYYAVVFPQSEPYVGAMLPIEFNLVNKSLKGASVYEVNPNDAKDVSDTEFEFTNAKTVFGPGKNINFTLDGEALTYDDIDYSQLKLYNKGESTPFATADQVFQAGVTLFAGDYVAVILGGGDYAGSTVEVPFTVKPFDVTNATIVMKELTEGASLTPTIETINGSTDLAASIGSLLKFDFKSSNNGSDILSKPGTYTYTVAPKAEKDMSTDADYNAKAAASMTGEQDVTFDVLAANAATADFFYGSQEWSLAFDDNAILIDYSEGDPALDVDNIVVKNGGTRLSADQYDIVVTDKDGKVVDNDSIAQPGEWTLTVTVDSAACDYKVTGSATAKVTVRAGVVNEATDVYFKYDGDVVTSVEATYDGTDVIDAIEVVVKTDDGEKTLVEGTDYTVVATDAEGNEVDEIVNVLGGPYTLTVKSTSWQMPNGKWLEDSMTVTVAPIKPTAIRVAGLKTIYRVNQDPSIGLPYTGSAIVPTFEYTTDDLTKVEGGIAGEDVNWTTLPADAYVAKYTGALEKDGSIVKVGKYGVTLSANPAEEDAVVASNYDVDIVKVWNGNGTTPDNSLWIINDTPFQDVKVTDWYAEPLSYAKVNELVNGYYGTQLFGPAAQITRADVVCILFNVAGGTDAFEGSSTDLIQWASKFTDVDASQYYAQAIGWAAKSGVVNGYGDGTFAPEQNISREEFAAMLANYAKALRNYDAVEDVEGVLGTFSDGNEVSDWAKAEVAWAAQNKVMGNGGYLAPKDQITRAEAAAMTVNFVQEYDL